MSNCQLPNIYTKGGGGNKVQLWPVVTDENDHYKMEVLPYENVDQMLPFEVKINNNGNKPIEIDPMAWRLHYGSGFEQDTIPLDTASFPMTASQAGAHYHDIASRLEKAKKDARTALIIAGVVLVVGIIVLAAVLDNDGNGDNSDDFDFIDTSVNVAVGVNLTFQPYSSTTAQQWNEDEEINYFRSTGDFVRKMNLNPRTVHGGESDSFVLHFPRKANMNNLILEGNLNGKPYTWDFMHYPQNIFR